MKADRLLAILLLLQNHGKMTSRALSQLLEVSERTINRDMEALSAAGVPVYAERGAGGGWMLSDTYRTDLTGMKTEEISSLLLTGKSTILDDLGIKRHYESAYQKLLAASPPSIRQSAETVRQKIHIDGAGWSQSKESFPYLSIIQEAVWEEKQLQIKYKRDSETIDRTVHPLGLVAKRSIWYLVAEVDDTIRTYRISRITDARMTDQHFDRPEEFELASYWEQSTEQFKKTLPSFCAKIKANESTLSRLVQERFVTLIHREPIGSDMIEAEMQFETIEYACQIILGYSSLIHVLAPQELRDLVLHEAYGIIRSYE